MTGAVPRIDLPCVFDDATFARYEPFGDGRYFVTRRGPAVGFDYGLEQHRRTVDAGNGPVDVVRMRSPLPCAAGPVEHDVVLTAAVEICIPVSAGGFTEDEVGQILAAIRLPAAPADRD